MTKPSRQQISWAVWVKRNAGWLILLGLFVIVMLNALRMN